MLDYNDLASKLSDRTRVVAFAWASNAMGTVVDALTPVLGEPKSASIIWKPRIETPPLYAYPVRPGITFTYLGVKVDTQANICFAGQASANLFAAGEIMAGNVLGQGYAAGVGMTIGTAQTSHSAIQHTSSS